jgi:hypothetical protein
MHVYRIVVVARDVLPFLWAELHLLYLVVVLVSRLFHEQKNAFELVLSEKYPLDADYSVDLSDVTLCSNCPPPLLIYRMRDQC